MRARFEQIRIAFRAVMKLAVMKIDTAAKRPLAFSRRTSFQSHRLSPRASRRRVVDAKSATDAFPSEESRMTSEKRGSLMEVEMTRGRRDFLRLSAAGGAG